jgi:hypothetical protein
MPPIRGFSVYCENFQGGDFTADEWEFVAAVAAYQKRWGRRYPSWREAFHILISLGYRKVAPPTPLPRTTEPEREVVAQALRAAELEKSKHEIRTSNPDQPPPAPGP